MGLNGSYSSHLIVGSRSGVELGGTFGEISSDNGLLMRLSIVLDLLLLLTSVSLEVTVGFDVGFGLRSSVFADICCDMAWQF